MESQRGLRKVLRQSVSASFVSLSVSLSRLPSNFTPSRNKDESYIFVKNLMPLPYDGAIYNTFEEAQSTYSTDSEHI